MNKLILTAILAVAFITSYGVHTVCADETDWTMHIKVSVPDPRDADGAVWNHLVAGVHKSATDGYDNAKDTVAWVEADDKVQAIFVHGTVPEDSNNDGLIDQWTCALPDKGYTTQNCSLWRDIREIQSSGTWLLAVLTTSNSSTVSLDWSFERVSEKVDIVLIDLANPSTTINMKDSSGHSYTGSFETGNKYGIRYFEIRMKTEGVFITPSSLPDATVGSVYSARVSAVGGTPGWSIKEASPLPWLKIDAVTGEITGMPVETGACSFTIYADDPASSSNLFREYTIRINAPPKIETSSLPHGTAGSFYQTTFLASGGSAPLRWKVSGNLPEGLFIDQGRGTVSGTPIVPGFYDFEIYLRDANNASDTGKFLITVAEPDDITAPDAIRDLRIVYVSDSSALLMWTAPADDSMTGTSALYDMRYSEDCTNQQELDWDRASEAGSEPRPQAGTLQTYTLAGLSAEKSYCIAIKSVDAGSHISPVSNIVLLPSSLFSEGSSVKEVASAVTLREGYNLISFPLMPVPNSSDVLVPAVGSTVGIYRWYSYYPEVTPPQYYLEEAILPGFGYILYSPDDNVKLSVKGVEIIDAQYAVALQGGWNMIGVPYNRSFILKDLMVRTKDTGEVKPYSDAVKDGLIGNTIYYLNGANYEFASFNDDPPATMEPWAGYWIYVGEEKGVEIIFRRE